MLRIRLQRRGKKNFATYRVVVADRGAPIKGKFVADLGPYNPHTDVFKVNKEVVLEWINKGAKPTATVHNLLVDNKVIKAKKVTSWRPKKKEDESEPTAASNESPETDSQNDEASKKEGKAEGPKGEQKKAPVDDKPEVSGEKKEGLDNSEKL